MEVLFVIPARGGSKGVPKKNIKLLAGKPLIYYTIDVARELTIDDNICVSTDDLEIIKVVENYGLNVPFIRPKELSSDSSSTNDVLMHALNFYQLNGKNYDVIALLQPTSPFRKAHHVKEALQRLTSEIDMVVSVKETKSNPYYVLFEENSEGFLSKSKDSNFTRRQDCPAVWEFNGAIYIINIESLKVKGMGSLKKTVKYVMNEIESIDIDTTFDWNLCEFILNGID